MYIKSFITLFLMQFTIYVSGSYQIQTTLPTHLLNCYRSTGPNITSPLRLDLFLNILRKLETHESQLDIRMFSVTLLRTLRLDGIEQSSNPVENAYNTPYSATAFQFQKYKLLMDFFLPGDLLVDVYNDISEYDKCYFHRMISSTVDRWERGDENNICPQAMTDARNFPAVYHENGRGYSRCPIEHGVIQTEWANISPGTLISTIAAALQQETVLINDILKSKTMINLMRSKQITEVDIESDNEVFSRPKINEAAVIDNVWIAGLAGDLAEVVVNQGLRVGAVATMMNIGTLNKWNDEMLPKKNYLMIQNETIVNWHITEAEILGCIDGMIIAQEVSKWVNERASLKLSQVIEMYYSEQGVSFNTKISACNRLNNFNTMLDKDLLIEQTSSFAQVLAFFQGATVINFNVFNDLSEAAVEAFVTRAEAILESSHQCKQRNAVSSSMDVIVITDGTWNGYQIQQFILGLLATVSNTRARIGLMHGNTGECIVPITENFTTIFPIIEGNTNWPNRLNFPIVLTNLYATLNERTLNETITQASVAPPTVVLVMSPTDRPNDSEIDQSRELMQTLRMNYFDVHFMYVAQDLTNFYSMETDIEHYSDSYVQVSTTNVTDILKVVYDELNANQIPKRIIGAQCNESDSEKPQTMYTDYLFLDRTVIYRIHPYYLNNVPVVYVKFQTLGNGRISVTSSRDVTSDGKQLTQTLQDRDEYTFNITGPCDSGSTFCPPAYFSVKAISSLNNCAASDCRLPNQVGITIQHTGLRCLNRRSSLNSAFKMKQNFFLIFIYSVIVSIF